VKVSQPKLDALVAGVRTIFGGGLVGVYLHGSAALGCYGPHSDIDVLVALDRPSSPAEQEQLAALCLAVSEATWDAATHCLLELDGIVAPDLRPWRYPPPLDFHYSESYRDAFERGEPRPWRVDVSADLAASIRVLHAAGVVLDGAQIADVFPPVPTPDYRDAIARDLPWCLEHKEGKRLYAVLSLPRIWAGLTADDVYSKTAAADWALPRLPPELRPVLEHALSVYRGRADDCWAGLPVDDYIAYVVARITGETGCLPRASRRSVRPSGPPSRGNPRRGPA
jgi:streptomycin 3"-adenylyltransferase